MQQLSAREIRLVLFYFYATTIFITLLKTFAFVIRAIFFLLCTGITLMMFSCKKEGANSCPTSRFTISDSTVVVYDTIKFYNCSTNSDSIIIEFGDGQYSTMDTALHVYAYPGNYLVRLDAISDECINVSTQNVIVNGIVPSLIYGTYLGNCSDSIVFSDCMCLNANSLKFRIEGLFNWFGATATIIEVDSFTFGYSVTDLWVSGSGRFSSDLQTVTMNYTVTTYTYPGPTPISNSCSFVGIKQ